MSIRDELLAGIARDEQKIIGFFSGLVKCKSPNPPGDTRSAMTFVQRFLSESGLSYREVNHREDWPNLISSIPMKENGRHLMFNGHLDVFPADGQPGWKEDPWSGSIAEGRVWGRGTGDMKAGLTASIFAYSYLSRFTDNLKGRASLTVVSDEENGGKFGVGHMFKTIEDEMVADCVLSGESTTPRAVSFGGKGYIRFTVRVSTPGAHASAPFKSRSAVRVASDIIQELDTIREIKTEVPEALAERLRDPWVLQQLGRYADDMTRITLNPGVISGGAKVNVIASGCVFEFEARLPIGIDTAVVASAIRSVVEKDPDAKIEEFFVAEPDYCDPSGELAVTLQDTVESLGLPRPAMTPSTALSDCKYWRDRGIPAYWYGPTPVAGTANESVSIEELMILVRTHTLAAASYLSK